MSGTGDRPSAEAADWLATNWNDRMPRDQWLELVVDSGWAAPSWPVEWHGRGLAPVEAVAAAAEFRRVGAPGSGQDRTNLWAGTILGHGGDQLKRRFIRDLLLDRVPMCLLYSEPGAGSDLAGTHTGAERDGDEWVVNGQKVWTSGGHRADWGMLIARTNWDVPKHAGISFFWFPMRQPGVEVRPLRQATGDTRFNEVFLTDARVPASHLLGAEGQGWKVLQTALAYERAVMGGGPGSAPRLAQVRPSTSAGPAGSVVSSQNTSRTGSAQIEDDGFSIPPPDLSLVGLARTLGRDQDVIIRQRLAQLRCLVKVNEWNGQRARESAAKGSSSPTFSLGKLAMSRILHTAGSLETAILGAEGTIAGADSPRSAHATYSLHNAFFTSIGGGTDQIQRNIIGERILGLPKEPEVDRDVPFRDVVRGGRLELSAG